MVRAASAVRFDPAHPTALHDRDSQVHAAVGRSGTGYRHRNEKAGRWDPILRARLEGGLAAPPAMRAPPVCTP